MKTNLQDSTMIPGTQATAMDGIICKRARKINIKQKSVIDDSHASSPHPAKVEHVSREENYYMSHCPETSEDEPMDTPSSPQDEPMDTSSPLKDEPMDTSSSPQSIVDSHSVFVHYKYCSPDPMTRPSSYSNSKAAVDNSGNMAPPARDSSCHDEKPPHSHHHNNDAQITDEGLHVHTPDSTPASPMPLKSSGFTPINGRNKSYNSYYP